MASSIYSSQIWSPGKEYSLHDIVIYNNLYYYCINPGAFSTFSENNFGGFYQVNNIKLPNFLWTPSYSSKVFATPKVKSLTFGDNYEQRFSDVIFNNQNEYNLIFEKRSDNETKAILHFLKSRRNRGLFYWNPYSPFSKYMSFVCLDYKYTRNFINNNTITVRFREKLNIAAFAVINEPPPPPPPPPIEIMGVRIWLSMIAHWPLDETSSLSGDRFRNLIVPANYLTLNGSNVTSIILNVGSNGEEPANLIRRLLQSTSSTSYLEATIADSNLSFATNSRSIFGWFSYQPGSGGGVIFGKDNDNLAANRGYWLQITGQSSLSWNVYNSVGTLHTLNINLPNVILNSSFGSSTAYGSWYFFNCGFDKERQQIFFKVVGRGNKISSPSANLFTFTLPFVGTPNTNNSTLFRVGGKNGTTPSYFKQGSLTNISVINGSLFDDEMLYMYNFTNPPLWGIGRYAPFYIIDEGGGG